MIKQRASKRLQDFNYADGGGYFISICTHGKKSWFGTIRDGLVMLGDAGQIAKECWLAIPDHFPHVSLDEFIVMPNHMHGAERQLHLRICQYIANNPLQWELDRENPDSVRCGAL